MSTTCPSAEQLRAFVIGDLSGSDLESVAHHVNNCSSCDASLAAFDKHTDGFVSGLSVLNSVRELSPVPAEVMESAKQTGCSSSVTSSNFALDPGRRYAKKLSPEQARGDSHNVDERSDVYSLGVILYELLTVARPFQGNRRLVLLQTIEDDPRPPRQLDDHIPKDLETICLKAMSKSSTRRYQSAAQFAEDLRRFLAGDPILARPESYVEHLVRWCRRYPLAVSLFLAVVLGSCIGILYLSSLSEYFVRQTALGSSRNHAVMLDESWRYYSERIDALQKHEVPVKISPYYLSEDGTLPLPATWAIHLGGRLRRAASFFASRIRRNQRRPR